MDESKEFPLPDDLPEPEDDGEADHLSGLIVPSVSLMTTARKAVNLADLGGRILVYCYPKTGRPDRDVIPEGWEEIPGARGCTPESRGFRALHDEVLGNGIDHVFGLSLQSSDYQREAKDRLDLPFDLISDENLEFSKRLSLPTFEVEGERLLKRLTLVIFDGRIEHVFYPVFPPDEHAEEVLNWLKEHPDTPR